MNVIVVVADSLRRDHLGAYGNRWISTPHFDSFAARGMVFETAIAGSHPTVPNRTDCFTGRFTFPWRGWGPLPRAERVLATILKERQVVSMLIGDTYHLFKEDFFFQRGFTGFEWIRGQEGDKWVTDQGIPLVYPCAASKMRLPYPERYDEIIRNRHDRRVEEDWPAPRVYRKAMSWLERNYKHPRFLLWLDGFDPHEPWDPPAHYLDRYDPGYDRPEDCDTPVGDRWAPFYTPRELRRLQARYAGEVTLVDRWFGRFMQLVEDLGLFTNTLVVVTSDHGVYLGYPGDGGLIGKPVFTDREVFPLRRALIHVPLFVRLPGGRPGRTPAVVQPCDLLPSLLSFLEIPCPENLHGRSWLPAAAGKTRRHRDFALTSERLQALAVSDARYSFQVWPRRGPWEKMCGKRPEPVLFDRQADPDEKRNLARRERPTARRLHEALVARLEDIGAPGDFVDLYRE